MAGKRFAADQIIMKLREAEVGLAPGKATRLGEVTKTFVSSRRLAGGHTQHLTSGTTH